MAHRILPRREPLLHPLHRAERLGLLLFLGLFVVFSFLIVASRLSLSPLTGHVPEASTATRVNVTNQSAPFTCIHTLPAGTSLVSIPCLELTLPRQRFLSNFSAGGSNVAVIYKYTPFTSGKWSVYNASLPNYTVQSLSSVGRLDGLYFVMDAPETVTYTGFLPPQTSMALRAGWNLVGYPSNRTQDLAPLLSSVAGTYALVETLEGTRENGTYLTDTPPPGGETLLNMSIYHGYWFRMASATTWVVDR